MPTLTVSAQRIALFLVSALLAAQLLVPIDVFADQKHFTSTNGPKISVSLAPEKFFHVELIPNPTDKPFYESSLVEEYRCSHTNQYIANRSEFPSVFQGMLQSAFTPRVSTNMNMIVMGDSLGVQLSVLLQDAAATQALDSSNRCILAQYPKEIGIRDIYSVSKARGKGTIAQWRLFGMLRSSGLSAPLPPTPGGGWRLSMVEQMKSFAWNETSFTADDAAPSAKQLGSFDVMMFRIPQAWISLQAVNEESLLETVLLSAGLFGVKTIILVDMPLNKLYTETSALAATNLRVRSFVDRWQARRSASPQVDVFLLEMGALVTQAGAYNAMRLGYDANAINYIAEQMPNDPLLYPRPVATNCLERPQINETTGTFTDTCPLNMLFFDGLHVCMEAFGPRIVAGVGCIIQCAGKERDLHHQCEQDCNEKYMRLNGASIR